MAQRTEGNKCRCSNPAEHQLLVASIDESFKKDAARRASAPTSEQLKIRAKAATNGHTTIKV
jgi:hypothetical protein